MRYQIIFIFAIIICILYSCTTKNNVSKQYNYFDKIEEFEYKGHQYIRFQHSMGTHGTCGVVHNPECKKCTIYFDSI